MTEVRPKQTASRYFKSSFEYDLFMYITTSGIICFKVIFSIEQKYQCGVKLQMKGSKADCIIHGQSILMRERHSLVAFYFLCR